MYETTLKMSNLTDVDWLYEVNRMQWGVENHN